MKVNHTRGGERSGGLDDGYDRNIREAAPEAGGAAAADDSDSGPEEAAKEKKKAPRSLLERDEDLEAELNAQFGLDSGLTRKQREELERQAEERKEQEAIKNGETEQAAADMERLAEIRKRREEAAKKREQDQEEAKKRAAAEEAKAAEKAKQRAVAEQVAKFATAGKDGKVTLNFLNQDAACKKVLKPLCKKEGVKAINKAWLLNFPDLFDLKDDGKDIAIVAKTK